MTSSQPKAVEGAFGKGEAWGCCHGCLAGDE